MVSEHASPLATLGGVDAGGQNVYVSCLARALADRGHEVDVYTRRDGAGMPERVRLGAGVNVVHVAAGPARPLAKDELPRWMPDFASKLADAWRAGAADGRSARPDVVHAHFWMSGVAALQAIWHLDGELGPLDQLDRPSRKIPLVQTFHALGSVKRRFQGLDDTSPPDRIATEQELAGRVDQVIATCTDEVAELIALTGNDAAPKDVRVVPCGVDLQRFTPTGPRSLPVAVPGLSGAGESPSRLLYVGRLVERKGVDTVIEALARLPDCHLVVAGGPAAGDLGTDGEAVRLRALAGRLEVADRVHLIGRVAQADLPSALRWADVVVATPWYEPFGIVPLEAMACGRPFVGSAVGGLLDTVVPEASGVLVPPRDPGALAGAVRALLADPDRRRAMGHAARRRAVSRYGWDRVAEKVEAAYLGAIADGAGADAAGGPLTLLTPEAV